MFFFALSFFCFFSFSSFSPERNNHNYEIRTWNIEECDWIIWDEIEVLESTLEFEFVLPLSLSEIILLRHFCFLRGLPQSQIHNYLFRNPNLIYLFLPSSVSSNFNYFVFGPSILPSLSVFHKAFYLFITTVTGE